MTTIQAVIFDIGGVIIRTDDPAPREHLAQRFGLDRVGIDNLVFGSPAAQAAELGLGTEEAVWQSVRQSLNLTDDGLAEFYREFWAGDRLDFSLVELASSLRPKYKTALLTNTGSRQPLTIFTRNYGLPVEKAEAAFDAVFSSAALGIKKPDARIFKAALDGLGVKADAAVFIDDFAHNIEAAGRLGLRTILFRSPAQAVRELHEMLGE
jgi:epoxide hydrolase-like predicted phosphatase